MNQNQEKIKDVKLAHTKIGGTHVRKLQFELNSLRVKSITEVTTNLHNDVAELYESLIDGDYADSKLVINSILRKLKEIKFD